VVAWFSLAIIARGFAALFAQLLTSQQRGHELHGWAVVDFALRAAGAFAGSPFGVVGIAAGFSLVSFFVTLPVMVWIAGRSGPVKLRDQLAAVSPAAAVGAGAALAAAVVLFAATRSGLDAGWIRFLLVGSAAAATAAALTFLIGPARQALLGTAITEALRSSR
jgi:PST family polysaccharide transporter